MAHQEKSLTDSLSTPVLGLLTLIVTLIATVPAFLALNDEVSTVYYSVKSSHVSVPSTIDSNRTLTALEDAGIPGSTVELALLNQGNISAKSIKFEIETPSEIITTWSEPSKTNKPIWVEIPDLKPSPGSNAVQGEVKNLATTRGLRILVGYKFESSTPPSILVFSEGRPATKIPNIDSAPTWSKWDVFKLPAYIFLGGIGFIIAWSFVVALIKNPSFRSTVVDELIEATHVGYGPSAVARLIAKAVAEERKKNPQGENEGPNK